MRSKELVRGQIKQGFEKSFLFGGKALFTLFNEETQNHFTFRVVRSRNKQYQDFYFAYVLTGTDNTWHYSYMGYLKEGILHHNGKSRVSRDSKSFVVLDWFLKRIISMKVSLPKKVKMFHEGQCGRCGKILTTPESVTTGWGPECCKVLGIEWSVKSLDGEISNSIN